MTFKNYNTNSDLSCANITDKFSVSNNKAKLTYPVGLLTYPESYLLNNNNLRKVNSHKWWLLSPFNFYGPNAYDSGIYLTGSNVSIFIDNNCGVRPVVSLKPGTGYTSGTGSKSDPYVVQ